MRSLRSMCGVSRKDRYRNSDVSERYGLKEDVGARVERGGYGYLLFSFSLYRGMWQYPWRQHIQADSRKVSRCFAVAQAHPCDHDCAHTLAHTPIGQAMMECCSFALWILRDIRVCIC
ncbi:hypothetical protein EVAR_55340_1 [Eumeta japonica]|uniref:Uncharacterized protein n=1 Tax=Eumeta variegata TaxID=151549 RepID=A0A4C1YJ53_EUMVA|nr:hypothetical protein EVAR_55340_1 [Eumeta japonica]